MDSFKRAQDSLRSLDNLSFSGDGVATFCYPRHRAVGSRESDGNSSEDRLQKMNSNNRRHFFDTLSR